MRPRPRGSTLARSNLGLHRRSAGHLQVLGVDPETQGATIRGRIGYAPDGGGIWFHKPSEHSIDGQLADFELQVVHRATGNAQKQFLILSLMYK